jgi:hypothetical protein
VEQHVAQFGEPPTVSPNIRKFVTLIEGENNEGTTTGTQDWLPAFSDGDMSFSRFPYQLSILFFFVSPYELP